LEKEYENFQWHVALSQPKLDDQWQGYSGYIHQMFLEQYLNDHEAPEDCEYYLCGPPILTAAVVDMLVDLGVDPENILYDDFGS